MLAVAGGKGGVGKTTVSLGLARALARAGEQVTVVDADVDMPDLHIAADTPARPGLGAFARGEPLDSCRQPTPSMGAVGILSAPTDASSVRAGLARLADSRAPVIVDTPAGASPDTVTPIRLASSVVLVSTPTRQSLEDTLKTAALADAVDTPVEALLVNRSSNNDTVDLLCPDVPTWTLPTVSQPCRRSSMAATFDDCVRHLAKRNF